MQITSVVKRFRKWVKLAGAKFHETITKSLRAPVQHIKINDMYRRNWVYKRGFRNHSSCATYPPLISLELVREIIQRVWSYASVSDSARVSFSGRQNMSGQISSAWWKSAGTFFFSSNSHKSSEAKWLRQMRTSFRNHWARSREVRVTWLQGRHTLLSRAAAEETAWGSSHGRERQLNAEPLARGFPGI